mmetsp:Transcript_9403/g.10969  ORF Transcript_9403/g.10969 Transcript_9403/m.10969 type:complete len:200 (+) Transcript_9403:68-667(+)
MCQKLSKTLPTRPKTINSPTTHTTLARTPYSTPQPLSPSRPIPQTIPQINTTLTPILLLTTTQIQRRQPRHNHQNIHKHLTLPKPRKKLHIPNLYPKHLSHRGKPCVIRKRGGGELHHRQRAEQHERNVEQEGGHVGLPHGHGMKLKNHKVESELERTLEGTEQQVQRQNRHRKHPEQREKRIEPPQIPVQKRSQRFVR